MNGIYLNEVREKFIQFYLDKFTNFIILQQYFINYNNFKSKFLLKELNYFLY